MTEAQYLLSADVDEVRVGDSYDESLPLHITVMPWFELGNSGEAQVVGICHGVISTVPATTTIVTERAQFGPSEDVPVSRVKRTFELDALHRGLLRRLGSVGVQFMAPSEWLGDDWKPHVSDVAGMALEPGETVEIHRVHLFKREASKPTKKAILGFTLSGGAATN